MVCASCGASSPWHSSRRCGACRSVRPSSYRYDAAWRRKRAAWLRGHPSCVFVVNDVVCGRKATDVDHVVPLSKGGADHPNNYQSLCHEHHSTKTANEFAGSRAHHAKDQRGATAIAIVTRNTTHR